MPRPVRNKLSSPSRQKTSHTRHATSRGSDLLYRVKILQGDRHAEWNLQVYEDETPTQGELWKIGMEICTAKTKSTQTASAWLCGDLCYVGHLLNQVSYIQSLFFFLRQMNFKAFLSR